MKKTIVIIILAVFTGCTYKKAELVKKKICDTTDVSYSRDIEPIISKNCLMCHGSSVYATSGGGINLDGYSNISMFLATNKDRLLGAIKWQQGYSKMPKDRQQLNECDILKIETWINNNYPNN